MKFRIAVLIILFALPNLRSQDVPLQFSKSDYLFTWNLPEDDAIITNNGRRVWRGSLLPSLWIQDHYNEKLFVHAEFSERKGDTIFFALDYLGSGFIVTSFEDGVIRFSKMEIQWAKEPVKIVSLNHGLVELTSESSQVVPSLEDPCWPNWQSEGYCIPTAKGAPIQSFFRFWQFGSSTIPLGNFGSSLGTPYAAAFPRPFYALAMGGQNGWACFGAGTVPEGAMLLKIKTASSYLQYLYREDLWGAPEGRVRTWEDPLIISMEDMAWDAYRKLFSSLDQSRPVNPVHQLNHWNTWGDFKQGEFDMNKILSKANTFEAEVVTWDMMWETFQSSGIPEYNRFPMFNNDLNKITSRGMKTGFWQSVVWVADYEAVGLTSDDLVCGADGRPRLVNWINSPYHTNVNYYALDPSSDNAVKFLQERTRMIVRDFGADLLKLDFGYNIPSPDIGAPRNPEFRGEKYAYTLLKIIADAAREVNPGITLQYYGISPLMHPCYNLIAMDDMGDAGNWEKEGHGQWSIWASLAGIQGRAIMASSGYDWDADDEILMNTAIVGSPGLVLPGDYKGGPIPAYKIARRVAIARWYRRTTGWEPLWLNSEKGSLNAEPQTRCWGRLEYSGDEKVLTALALRQDGIDQLNHGAINGIRFSGEWVLLSRTDASVFQTKTLAIICFEDGTIEIPLKSKPAKVMQVFRDYEIEYTRWEYTNGKLSLENDPDFNGKAQCGFVVFR